MESEKNEIPERVTHMIEKKQRQAILAPLFWGALWGITEATFGHLLHIIKIPGLAGAFMFPIAVFFMIKVYSITGRLSSVLFTSYAAASLKFIDILISPHDLFAVLNPMLSILCESFVLVLFLKAWRKKMFSKLIPVFTLVLGWKSIYFLMLVVLGHLYEVSSFLNLGLTRYLNFFIGESLISGLMIYLFFKVHSFSKKSLFEYPRRFHYFLTAGVYILAVFIEALA